MVVTPLLGINPKDSKSTNHRDPHIAMFIEHNSQVMQPGEVSRRQWNKVSGINSGISFSHEKENYAVSWKMDAAEYEHIK